MLGMYTDITTLGSISFPTNSFNGNIFTATISPEGTLLTGMGLGTNNTTDRANDLELLADGAFALGGMTGTGVAPVKFGCINSVTPGFLVLKYNYETPPLPDVSFTQLREQRKVFFLPRLVIPVMFYGNLETVLPAHNEILCTLILRQGILMFV